MLSVTFPKPNGSTVRKSPPAEMKAIQRSVHGGGYLSSSRKRKPDMEDIEALSSVAGRDTTGTVMATASSQKRQAQSLEMPPSRSFAKMPPDGFSLIPDVYGFGAGYIDQVPNPSLPFSPIASYQLGENINVPFVSTDDVFTNAQWFREEYSNAKLGSLYRTVDADRPPTDYLDDDEVDELLREDPKKHEDELLATALQEAYNEQAAARLHEEKSMMLSTRYGRAVLFVKKVLTVLQDTLQQTEGSPGATGISAVAKDDMVALAERMMQYQEDLRRQGKPTTVDLGYHYTTEACMKHIKEGGLMTKKERTEQKVSIRANGAVFGDGIYTANNCFCFRSFGQVGLLVARLQGVVQRMERFGAPSIDGSFETVIGNKKKRSFGHRRRVGLEYADHYDEVVLLDSSQCVPLLRYPSTLIPQSIQYGGPYSNTPILNFHIAMQKVVDEFFNNNTSIQGTLVPPCLIPWEPANQLNNQAHNPPQHPSTPLPHTLPKAPSPFHKSQITTNVITTRSGQGNFAANGATSVVRAPNGGQLVDKKNKQRILMLVRVLMKYLEQKDPKMHQRAKQTIKDCAERNKSGEVGYEIVSIALRDRLRQLVGEQYWLRAETYLEHFLASRKSNNQHGGAGSIPSQNAATIIPSAQTPNQQGRAMVTANPTPIYPSASLAHNSNHLGPTLSMTANTGNKFNTANLSANLASASSIPASAVPPRATAGTVLNKPRRKKGRLKSPPSGPASSPAMEHYIYEAPNSLEGDLSMLKSWIMPMSATGDPSSQFEKEECPVCLDPLVPTQTNDCCAVKACGHRFHVSCIKSVVQCSPRCPVCRVSLGEPRGASPSGTVAIDRPKLVCDGVPMISITYNLRGGVQKSYHENPGARYLGISRTAYLPDTPEGNKLLRRLIYAFRCGLLFRVGTSMTTGAKNCITWASIHHKTSLRGGAHSFPDPSYITNCNKELDNLGVPEDPLIISKSLLIAGPN